MFKGRFLIFVGLFSGMLVLHVNSATPGGDDMGTAVYGRVESNGEGVHFITVFIEGTTIGTATGYDGRYILANIPEGRHIIKVQGIGYKSTTGVVELKYGEAVELNFELESDILLMEGVVVSGSRIGILRHLPGSAGTVSSNQIRAMAPLSGNDVLRSVPGVHVVEEEGAGLRTNIGIRGLDPDKSRNVLILEDGIPVALGPYGEPEMYYTPGIERMSGVEILKGSGSILYGPQTVGGVINYLTADPPAESSGFASLRTGSGGLAAAHVGYGNTYGNTGFTLNYLRRQADNLGPTAFTLNDINTKMRFKATSRSNVTVKLAVYDENSNSTYVGLTQSMYDAGNYDYSRLAPNDRLEVRRYSIGIGHDYLAGERLTVNSSVFAYTTTRNWRRQDFTYNPEAADINGVIWGNDNSREGAIYMRNSTGNRNRQFEVAGIEPRLRYRSTLFGMDNITDAGVRYLYERAYEQRVNGTSAVAASGNLRDDEIRTGHAFSSWLQNRLYLTGRLSFTAGLRTEMLSYERRIMRSSSIDVDIMNTTGLFEIIPGMGLNYNFNSQTGIFAGIHRGFAPPRIKDAISSDGRDMQLDAEKSWNLELGSRSKFFGFTEVELTLFYMDFSNQVIPVSESSGGSGAGYINGGRTNHRGLEVEASLYVSRFLSIPGTLMATANSTLTRSVFSGDRYVIRGIANGGTNDTLFVNVRGNRTPYSPSITGSGNIQYEAPWGTGIRLSANFTGNQYTDVLNTASTSNWLELMENDHEYTFVQATANGRIGKLSSFMVVDLSLWHEFDLGLRVNVAVKNLMDERYIATRRPQGIRVGLPRMVNAGLSYHF